MINLYFKKNVLVNKTNIYQKFRNKYIQILEIEILDLDKIKSYLVKDMDFLKFELIEIE
jgi:hypothetical protein